MILVGILTLSGCRTQNPSMYGPGERWAETKACQEDCNNMCESIDGFTWMHEYRHYNTEKCICKTIEHEFLYVTMEDGVLIISKPSKIDFKAR